MCFRVLLCVPTDYSIVIIAPHIFFMIIFIVGQKILHVKNVL